MITRRAPPTPARWLAAWAVSYNVAHHLGLLPAADAGGGTRWNDWLDLAVPYAVVGTALAALAACRTDRRGWVAGLVGAGLYAQGHGLHLGANSIANARGPAAPVHLWDEVVGHALWYAGVAVLITVLVRAAADVAPTTVGWALAAATGVTWATNALGAEGLPPYGLAVALGLAAYGWQRRTGAGRLLLAGSAVSTLVLGAVLV